MLLLLLLPPKDGNYWREKPTLTAVNNKMFEKFPRGYRPAHANETRGPGNCEFPLQNAMGNSGAGAPVWGGGHLAHPRSRFLPLGG